MRGSVYKIIDVVGSSEESWEKAAEAAIEVAGKKLKDLRIAEVTKMDMKIDNGRIKAYRVRMNLSFKYHTSED